MRAENRFTLFLIPLRAPAIRMITLAVLLGRKAIGVSSTVFHRTHLRLRHQRHRNPQHLAMPAHE
jgi:hypothetical protein